MKRNNFYVSVVHSIPVMRGAFVVMGTGCSVSKKQEKIKLNFKKKIYAGVCYNKLIILSFILGNKKYILLRRKSNLIVVHNRWCLFNILFLKVIKNTIHIFLNQGFVEKQSFFFFWKKGIMLINVFWWCMMTNTYTREQAEYLVLHGLDYLKKR